MQLIKQQLFKNSSFAGKYLQGDKNILRFYDYNLTMEKERAEELSHLNFQREKVADAMKEFHEKFFPCNEAFYQINRLRENNAVTVVGGQQAGLFTGPMYTIHKIISIITEAKRLENILHQPVIPIFWIAGEDHDIDEINHTYVQHSSEIHKVRIPEKNNIKTPASERKIDPEKAIAAVTEGLRHLQETKYTKWLKESLLSDVEENLTYTSWCAKILYRLFKGTGLVIMDAHDPAVRRIESNFFLEMTEKNNSIRKAFTTQSADFNSLGFGEPVEVDEDNAHLFLHDNHQRFLLQSKDGIWKEKTSNRVWQEAEFKEKVASGEYKLSNNVITRPVMQDLLLPVHTFIAGAGELAYWGVLKPVFHLFGHKMPIVRPRHSVTLLSRKSEKTLKQYDLSVEDVLNGEARKKREQTIAKVKSQNNNSIFYQIQKDIIERFEEIPAAQADSNSYLQLHEHYKKKLTVMLEDYEQSIDKKIKELEGVHLNRLSSLEAEIFPNAQKQERQISILSYLNTGGPDTVSRLLNKVAEEESGTPAHFVSYL
ncbi:bacillithiol biosynthesis cysteine-adding enzyme BshC [Alkalicoccus daliensis]|uniref:Putative cysteine ligase BshC n=1 Tax=Alkalicoccus daliensis TaxID=745820 RepID=A0A1G9ZU92_9BACI|nr:bacillithiol biosynthesis cysteine-adding enzyme BshC [Alkalicoccus daliensis]SDN24790.1 bacillithiol biosynthesis cysteine-adding enzyme BshC [Alkalicoccus daliensis]